MPAVRAHLSPAPAPAGGTRLRVARCLRGYTQSEVARRTGLSATGVSEVEGGKRSVAPGVFARCFPTAPAFLSREAPDFQMVAAQDPGVGGRASELVGIIIADLYGYVRPPS
ncbi:MAG: helix-turn-helix transcriptional regulator [bacterium]|nr:helix-turn-helix transcriptional regulator [bacterium]